MADRNFIELRLIFILIRRWWWLIGAISLLAAVIAFIATSIMPPVYESSAMLLVNPSKNSTTSQYNDLMAGTQLASTYSKMLTDRPVLESVITELRLNRSADELAKQITAEPVPNSQIIKLTVADSDPKQAALIANTLAQAFTRRVEEISTMRYALTIKNAKDRADNLQIQMKDLQEQIDELRSQKVTRDVTLANKQTLLSTLQSEYQSLQNSYQNMQLAIAEETGKVHIVGPVRVQKGTLQAAVTAIAVVSVAQSQSSGGNSLAGDRLALEYAQLIIKPSLLQEVINDLDLDETTDQLSKKISSNVITGTQLIQFTVQESDETKAQLIMQSLVDAFIAQVKLQFSEPYSDQLERMQNQIKDMEGSINSAQTEIGALTSEIAQMAADLDRLDTVLSTTRSDYRESQQKYEQVQTTALAESDAIIITEPAQAPKHTSQHKMLYIVIAAFLGLTVGLGSAFVLSYLNSKIHNDQDVRSALNLPVFSTIGQLAKKEKDLVMGSTPTSIIAEDFRVLSNKIRLISQNASVKTLLVTSPVPNEGKSLIISNLAIGLTRMGLRVVLVDADLRLPRLHNLFEIAQNEGLTATLREENINGSLQSTSIGQLKILTSGRIPSDPAELLTSPYLEDLLHELKENADLVLIDCPPVLVASDASILASKVDGVLLVLRANFSHSKTAQDAVETLEQVKAKLVGIVLNSVPNHRTGYSYYQRSK